MTSDEEKSIRDLLAQHLDEYRGHRDEDRQWKEKMAGALQALQATDVTLSTTLDGASKDANEAREKALAADRAAYKLEAENEMILAQVNNVAAHVRALNVSVPQISAQVSEMAAQVGDMTKLRADANATSARIEAATATLEKATEAAEKATRSLESASKSLSTAALWRKLRVPAIGLVSAILSALAGRFVLPPAAPNSPSTLLPGPTPTVAAVPAAPPAAQ